MTILKEYKEYLEEKGHREEYINDHIGFFKFFRDAYLSPYNGQHLSDLNDITIQDFLGDWAIRKIGDFGKGDIQPMLRKFKKFSSFLYHSEIISRDQYDSLKQTYKYPKVFVEKFERYIDLNPDSETWNEDFEGWLCDKDVKNEEDLKHELTSLLEAEKGFIEGIPESLFPNMRPIVEDFKIFCNYISNFEKGVNLTNGLFCLKREDILKINSMVNNSEELDDYVDQQDTVLIHFFFLVAKRLGFCTYTPKMRFKTTPLFQNYLKFTPEHQYLILFRGLWDKISWYRLNEYSCAGRPRWLFADRYLLSDSFSTIPVDKWFPIRSFLALVDRNVQESLGFSKRLYYFGLFLDKLLLLFKHFGLFDLNSNDPSDLSNFDEFKVKITPLGNQVFSSLKT
ncbi:MAG: hypothetical protein R6U96_07870 [Promethearchaeia archaeon]